MSLEQVQLPCTIPKSGMRGLADGGLRITLDTPELNQDETAKLFSYRGMTGYCVLAPQLQSAPINVPAAPVAPNKGQSPSQELRSVLYRIWFEKTNQDQSFEEVYYPHMMRSLIEKVKERHFV